MSLQFTPTEILLKVEFKRIFPFKTHLSCLPRENASKSCFFLNIELLPKTKSIPKQ